MEILLMSPECSPARPGGLCGGSESIVSATPIINYIPVGGVYPPQVLLGAGGVMTPNCDTHGTSVEGQTTINANAGQAEGVASTPISLVKVQNAPEPPAQQQGQRTTQTATVSVTTNRDGFLLLGAFVLIAFIFIQ